MDYRTDEPMKTRDTRSALEEAKATPPVVFQPDLTQESVLLQVIARGAADKTLDLDRMERLLVMQERLAAKRAESDFIHAMAEFKENPPAILKDKRVSFPHQNDSGETSYMHATLGSIVAAATAGLGRVGITHRWDLNQLEGGRIEVTCILTHVGGHSVRVKLAGSPDSSGKKNNIQQVASTVTYLQRYTLLAATGLAAMEQDDDGRGSDEEVEYVNEEQVANLVALLTEYGKNQAKFLIYFKIGCLEDLPARSYEPACALIRQPTPGASK